MKHPKSPSLSLSELDLKTSQPDVLFLSLFCPFFASFSSFEVGRFFFDDPEWKSHDGL